MAVHTVITITRNLGGHVSPDVLPVPLGVLGVGQLVVPHHGVLATVAAIKVVVEAASQVLLGEGVRKAAPVPLARPSTRLRSS